MEFEAGEFILLGNQVLLEVVYADAEKAVCMKLQKNDLHEWEYTGKSTVISNEAGKYKNTLLGWEKVPEPTIDRKFRWHPLLPVLNFPYLFD